MGDFDRFDVHALKDMVELDKLALMREQAQGWGEMASLFLEQMVEVGEAVGVLRQAWGGAAAEAFVGEMHVVVDTLMSAQRNAAGNYSAWTEITDTAVDTRAKVEGIHARYEQERGAAWTKFEKDKKKDESGINWSWGGLADI